MGPFAAALDRQSETPVGVTGILQGWTTIMRELITSDSKIVPGIDRPP